MSAELIVIVTVGAGLLIVQIGMRRMFRSEFREMRSEIKDLQYRIARVENILFHDDGPGPDPRT